MKKFNVVRFEDWLGGGGICEDGEYSLPCSIDSLPCGCRRLYGSVYTGGDVQRLNYVPEPLIVVVRGKAWRCCQCHKVIG